MGDLECPLCAHLEIVRELTEGIGCVLPKLRAIVRADDLNAMALKVGVICRHGPCPNSWRARQTARRKARRGHQNNAILQVKMSVNVGMAKLVNVGAGIDLARSERLKKEGCTEKQNTRLYFHVTNMIIAQGLAQASRTI